MNSTGNIETSYNHPCMKDSGVDWIGNVPESWSVVPFKSVADVQAGYPFDSSLFSNTGGFPLIRIRDITSGTIETYYTGSYSDEYVVTRDDFLIGMDGDYRVRWWESEDALLNQRCCRVILEDKVLRRFLYYQLPISLKVINDQTYSTTVKHLSNDDVRNMTVYLPSNKNELASIVDILDQKTSQIENFIFAQNEMIVNLEKMKQSIISEVVTKGLDPNVPLKDSGVDWIGSIPESWDVSKMKYLGELYSAGVDKKVRDDESLYRSIHYMDVYNHSLNDIVDSPDFLVVSCPENKVEKCKLIKGDILFTTSSETPDDIGHSAMISQDMDNVLFGYHLLRFRPGKRLNSSFAKYVFGATPFRSWLSYRAFGMTRYGVDNDSFASAMVQVPPIEEQCQIADYLDSICHSIDEMIHLRESIINKMAEYRQSVVYEYVTGKNSVSGVDA